LVDPIIAPGVIPVPNWYLSSHPHHDDDHRGLDTVTKQPRRNPHFQPRKDAPLTKAHSLRVQLRRLVRSGHVAGDRGSGVTVIATGVAGIRPTAPPAEGLAKAPAGLP
jgi:hypothetical protein